MDVTSYSDTWQSVIRGNSRRFSFQESVAFRKASHRARCLGQPISRPDNLVCSSPSRRGSPGIFARRWEHRVGDGGSWENEFRLRAVALGGFEN